MFLEKKKISLFGTRERFNIFRLDPDSIHFQFLPSVDLKSPVHQVLSLLQAGTTEELPHLLLGEEVAPGAVASHVEIVLYTLPLLEPKLSQVVSRGQKDPIIA